MEDQTTVHRSTRVEPAVATPEIFTAEDYLEARALEDIFDTIALETGELSVDEHTVPEEGRYEKAKELLGLDVNEEFKSSIFKLLMNVDTTSKEIGITPFVHMLPSEADAYDPSFDRLGGPIKPFSQQLRYFVARYCVEHVERQEHNGATAPKEAKYKQAFEAARLELKLINDNARQLYTVDIPAYTTLYNFFDRQRGLDDNNLEVYLGRDGIYAYYGRIGEVAARGDTEQVLARSADIIIPTRMLYMVYSRNIMEEELQLRKDYIAQHISNTDSPHFYDTGYVGSIPEDIMKILGYSKQEINKRIHLLNTENNERRLEGIRKNVEISNIEDGPKSETASRNLKRNDNGTIDYTADPTSIERQLQFLVMRTILIRHFWIKEYEEITRHLSAASLL